MIGPAFRTAATALLLASLPVTPLTAAKAKAITSVAPPPPPYQGAYQPQGVDEIGLWREDDESERALAASNIVIGDEKLTGYVKSVLCKAVGVERCKATRVYILREPVFNASMSYNGTMRVYSGALLRLRNEAELAALLGHEFGHFEQRHGLQRFKARRTGGDILAWGALLANIASSYNGYRAYRGLETSIYGSYFRFSRDNEREADLLGLGYLNTSAMRPQAAAAVWQNLMSEANASALSRGRNKPDFDSVAFYASHPPDGEREAYLGALADPNGAKRDDGAASYRAALAPWLDAFLADQIKLNDFGGSEYIIEGLAEGGWTPTLWQARGELYRTRGNQRDLVHAAEFYTNAIGLDPALAEAHRGLGLSLLKTGRREEGMKSLARYLELKPDASDAKMIRMMVPKEGQE